MTHHHDHLDVPDRSSFFSTPAGWTLVVFLTIGGFYLVTEHAAHLFGFLPFAFLLSCPLMHVFMHGRHGGHGRHNHGTGSAKSS